MKSTNLDCYINPNVLLSKDNYFNFLKNIISNLTTIINNNTNVFSKYFDNSFINNEVASKYASYLSYSSSREFDKNIIRIKNMIKDNTILLHKLCYHIEETKPLLNRIFNYYEIFKFNCLINNNIESMSPAILKYKRENFKNYVNKNYANYEYQDEQPLFVFNISHWGSIIYKNINNYFKLHDIEQTTDYKKAIYYKNIQFRNYIRNVYMNDEIDEIDFVKYIFDF